MTTIVAVRKGDSVAIGADTLTKFDTTKESARYIAHPTKLVHVGENTLAICGDASLNLIVRDYFSHIEEEVVFDNPLNIFRALLKLHRALKEDYFIVAHDGGDLESSLLRALIANKHGIFGVYHRRSVDEYTRFYAFGSGSEFAKGAMHALYDTGATAETIARAGLAAGAEFDDSTGAPFEVEVIELQTTQTPPHYWGGAYFWYLNLTNPRPGHHRHLAGSCG